MKKDYPIKIGQRELLLRFNYDALTYVEDVTGKPFFEALQALSKGHLGTVKVLLAAGLRKNHADIEDVGGLIDEADDLTALITGVVEAVNNYFARDGKAAKTDSKKKMTQGSASPTVVFTSEN
jgi:hypothetical protein